MPRRPSANPRDRLLNFRCTDKEARRVQSLAKKSRVSVSDFVRSRVLKARKSRKQLAPFVNVEEDNGARELAHQVHKVGVNLNQIARQMHTFQQPPPAELRELLKDIRDYVRQAQQL